jgi:hypothetical protein
MKIRHMGSVGDLLVFNYVTIEVARIYDNFVTVTEMYKFQLNPIFSADESEFSRVQKPASVIVVKKKELGLPRVLSEDTSHSRRVPPGSIYLCSKVGWMNKGLFGIWLKTFVSDVQSSIQNPTLPLMYTHSSYVSV